MLKTTSILALAASMIGGVAMAQGTTSGPAAGTPTTNNPSQSVGSQQTGSSSTKGGNAVSTGGTGQASGNGTAIVPGVSGAESGSNPGPGQRPQSR